MAQASEKDLLRIYRKRTDWTFRTFTDEVKKETGVAYSSTQGFKSLLRLRSQTATEKTPPSKASSAWMDDLKNAVAKAGSEVKAKAKRRPTKNRAIVMKHASLAVLIAVSLGAMSPSKAEDWITSDGKTYKNVSVVKFDAANVTILDADGGASVPLAVLPADLQKKFHYDAKAATVLKAQEDAQAAADLKAAQAEAAAKAQLEAKAVAEAKAQQDAQAAADASKAKATADAEKQKEAINQKAKADFDSADKVNVNGQVFITTKGGDAVKLSSIHIYLFSADQINSTIAPLVEESLRGQAKLKPDLDKAKEAYTKVVNATEAGEVSYEQGQMSADDYDKIKKLKGEAETLYEHILTKSYDYQSQAYYTAGLPAALADAVSDSDGAFIISIPRKGSWIIEAEGERSVGAKTEGYFWLTKVRPDAVSKNQILLNNENLSTGNSSDSVVYALDKYEETELIFGETSLIEEAAAANRDKQAGQ